MYHMKHLKAIKTVKNNFKTLHGNINSSKLLYKLKLITPLDPSRKNESNGILHAQNGVTKLLENQF